MCASCMKSSKMNPKIYIFKNNRSLLTFNGLTLLILSFIEGLVQLPITYSVLIFDPSPIFSDLKVPSPPVLLSSQRFLSSEA